MQRVAPWKHALCVLAEWTDVFNIQIITHPYYRSYIFLDYQSVESTLKYETFLKSNIMLIL